MVCEAGEMGIRGRYGAVVSCRWLFGRGISQQNGYKCSKTAGIYTHVATKDLRRIRSPLDMPGGGKHPE